MQHTCQISPTLDLLPNTNMSAAQNTHVSGANALDLGSVVKLIKMLLLI